MLNKVQIDRMLSKLKRYEKTLEPYIFTKIFDIEAYMFQTNKQFHQIPSDEKLYTLAKKGDIWGGEASYCWFKGIVEIPNEYANENIYIRPKIGGYESMLFVNEKPYGTFNNKITNTAHGNHYISLISKNAKANQKIDFAIESYAGHYIFGTQPFETKEKSNFKFSYEGIDICIKNQNIANFIYDLKTLNQLAQKLSETSFRKADVISCLTKVHKVVYYSPNEVDKNTWLQALEEARDIMKKVLDVKNTSSAPQAGIVGHSHMDTAWLWPIKETIKKCARTFSNQISLMDQYPEYRFIQSSSYHSEMIRLNYPKLFEEIKKKVKEGRYEPNGAVWVECDCNITSGESLVRQFLWGQRFTRKHFGYTSNSFWLPDTFGYSGAIPQIMKGCSVDYFLTTKLSWNDTNKFPHETFSWEGIDGTKVFTHFNTTHCWPDAKTLIEQLNEGLQDKNVSNKRLVAYGFGDGGGGPQFEMIEMAKRVEDLDGSPKAKHVNVGDFINELKKDSKDVPTHRGELYLELHRATLTSKHKIKENNRKAEIALHNLELIDILNKIDKDLIVDSTKTKPLWETILVNQFHDILPGTSIPQVHDRSINDMNEVRKEADNLINEYFETDNDESFVSVFNPLGFTRNEPVYIDYKNNLVPASPNTNYQKVKNIQGEEKLFVDNINLPSFGSATIELKKESNFRTSNLQESNFEISQNTITTPYAKLKLNKDGSIDSFIDTRNDRQLRGDGYPLNTFLMAEDVPSMWDTWDIDADCELKFKPCNNLVETKIISNGKLQLRIRNKYKISSRSILIQDMILYSHTPRIDFETQIDWHDKHRFLKVGFDTTIMSPFARHEIQFGHIQKPTTRNNTYEEAMFEVLNHKYTDLSENRYGISILNDCKYGISVNASDMRLSLMKGGLRPDPRGDEGTYTFTYSFLPHLGHFSSKNTILPSYSLNYPPIIKKGKSSYYSLMNIEDENVIIETVKPCEDEEKAFIIRLYEAEGTYSKTKLNLNINTKKIERINMLEETIDVLDNQNNIVNLTFTGFEIKTLKIYY